MGYSGLLKFTGDEYLENTYWPEVSVVIGFIFNKLCSYLAGVVIYNQIITCVI